MKPEHARKFAEFLRMCREAEVNEIDVVVVAHPRLLGDNYEELVTNLALLAEHGLVRWED